MRKVVKRKFVVLDHKMMSLMNFYHNNVLQSIILYISSDGDPEFLYGKLEHWLERGVDPNTRNNDSIGWAPLHYAAMVNSARAFDLLLSKGGDVSVMTDKKFYDYVMKDYTLFMT